MFVSEERTWSTWQKITMAPPNKRSLPGWYLFASNCILQVLRYGEIKTQCTRPWSSKKHWPHDSWRTICGRKCCWLDIKCSPYLHARKGSTVPITTESVLWNLNWPLVQIYKFMGGIIPCLLHRCLNISPYRFNKYAQNLILSTIRCCVRAINMQLLAIIPMVKLRSSGVVPLHLRHQI